MGRFSFRYFLSKFEPTHSPRFAPAVGKNSIFSSLSLKADKTF